MRDHQVKTEEYEELIKAKKAVPKLQERITELEQQLQDVLKDNLSFAEGAANYSDLVNVLSKALPFMEDIIQKCSPLVYNPSQSPLSLSDIQKKADESLKIAGTMLKNIRAEVEEIRNR